MPQRPTISSACTLGGTTGGGAGGAAAAVANGLLKLPKELQPASIGRLANRTATASRGRHNSAIGMVSSQKITATLRGLGCKRKSGNRSLLTVPRHRQTYRLSKTTSKMAPTWQAVQGVGVPGVASL